MKANELMIGDWMKFPGGTIDKIVDLPFIEGKGLCASFAASATLFPFPIEKIEPIPLTPEILIRNGFECQDQGGGRIDIWTGFGPDCEGDIEIEFNNSTPKHLKINGAFKGEYYVSSNILYIHQLQHALRLCGIEKEIEI